MANVITDDVPMDALNALFIKPIKATDSVKRNIYMNAPSKIFCVRRET